MLSKKEIQRFVKELQKTYSPEVLKNGVKKSAEKLLSFLSIKKH